MIKASHHPVVVSFFNRYVSHIMRKDFYEIHINGRWNSDRKGSLIIGNHISWWDGFWGLYLSNRFLHKRFHVMMLEEQLQQRLAFSRAGAFSMRPGSRSVVDSLDYASSLLNNPGNAVLIFPQGILNSLYNRTFTFEKGIDKILKQVPDCQILFYAVFVEFFSQRKPSLFFYLSEVDQSDKRILQQQYQDFYDHCVAQQAQMKG